MTTAQLVSLVLLGLVLVLAIWRRMNIGVLALAAGFVVLEISGTDAKKMYAKFPGDIVVLIVGVSLLFAHLERSGALRWLVDKVYATVGDRTALLPWAGFVIAAVLSSAGAFSTAPIALLVPMIAHVCVHYRRSFYLSELAVVIAANCCGLSPLNPTGAVVSTVAKRYHVTYSQWGLWAVSLATAVVAVLLLQLLDAARRRRSGDPERGVVTPAPAADEQAAGATPSRAYAVCAGLALLVFVVLVVWKRTDVGVTALALVVLLQLAFRPDEASLIARVPWSPILLLAGLLTYLGLMDAIGTMKSIENGLHHIHSLALLALVMAYLTALLCNIESSTLGVLGLMMPLVMTTFGTSPQLFWILAAVAVPAALMVMNPIHVAGTLIVANSAEDEQPVVFRRLLATAVTMAVIAPGVLAAVPALALAG